MTKLMPLLFCFLLLTSFAASAQVYDGFPGDSTIIKFTHDSIPNFIADTSVMPLWQIGQSHKIFFGIDTTGPSNIMTDTIHKYPVNANNWFIINVTSGNTIIDFWHRCQTNIHHAGGMVEFSVDSGKTWQNVKGSCNSDGTFWPGVVTANFYSAIDTLYTGEPSFTGVRDSTQYSRFQFYDGPAVRPAGLGCEFYSEFIYVRFRFVSDSIPDSLAGWIIDSIKIEHDIYWGRVATINKPTTLNVYPNPSYNATFIFPALIHEEQYSIEVYNPIGERVLKTPYKQSIDLRSYAKGLYFYKVSDGTEYYTGRLLIE